VWCTHSHAAHLECNEHFITLCGGNRCRRQCPMRHSDDSRSNVCRSSLGGTKKPSLVKSLGNQLTRKRWVCKHTRPPSVCAIGVPGFVVLVGAAEMRRHCKGRNATNLAKLIRLQSAQHMCACSCWTQQHADGACMQGYILLRLPPRKATLCCGRHRTKAIKNKFDWWTGDRTRV
jgi:hypothetical protein